jgi:excisionase family DNA binding protein
MPSTSGGTPTFAAGNSDEEAKSSSFLGSPRFINPLKFRPMEENLQLVQRLTAIEQTLLQMTILSGKQALTLDEAARYTGLSHSQLYKMTSEGSIPHYKPRGKLIYFDRDELAAWSLRNPVGPRSYRTNTSKSHKVPL